MRHTDFHNILIQNRFDKFIILTIILPLEHDPVIRREHALGDHLASGRVLGDLSAEVEDTTDFDRLGKRAGRRRELGRDNCGLVHR